MAGGKPTPVDRAALRTALDADIAARKVKVAELDTAFTNPPAQNPRDARDALIAEINTLNRDIQARARLLEEDQRTETYDAWRERVSE